MSNTMTVIAKVLEPVALSVISEGSDVTGLVAIVS
jgi:hypothetical protein